MQGDGGICAREGGFLMGGMGKLVGGFASFLDRCGGFCCLEVCGGNSI